MDPGFLLVMFVLLVAWPFTKGCCLFFFDHAEWLRQRQRAHEVRMENKRMATGIFGFFRRLLGG